MVHQPSFTAGFLQRRIDVAVFDRHGDQSAVHPDQTRLETNLTKDSLAREQLSAKTNDKAQHC